MKTCKTGCGGKMKAGGSVKKVKKMATGGQALNKARGYAPAQKGGSNVSKQIYGIPNAGTTGPNRTAAYDYKKGGSTTSRAVMESCKNGMVRDFDGKCVTERKMEKGGSLKPVNKIQNPGLAKLPTAVRNKMGYMKKGGVKKK
jgi:hypothetical protein